MAACSSTPFMSPPEARTSLMAAKQRSIAGGAFADASGLGAWKTPSWAVIATEDVGAGTDVVRSMPERQGQRSPSCVGHMLS
jgi:hypothetical protein